MRVEESFSDKYARKKTSEDLIENIRGEINRKIF